MIDNQKNYVNNITIKGASEWAVTVNQAYTWYELLGGGVLNIALSQKWEQKT